MPPVLAIRMASTFRQRLCGVRAWPDWEEAAWGLLLPRCRAVHTLWLARAIDVVFLSRAGGVLDVRPCLAPRRHAWCPGAWGTLELPPGYCSLPGWMDSVSAGWVALKIEV